MGSESWGAGKRWRETQRKSLRAYQRKWDLIQRLGGKCVTCGSRKRLEVDHINGRDWDITKKNAWIRVARYEKEEKEGKLQVLCKHCNTVKG